MPDKDGSKTITILLLLLIFAVIYSSTENRKLNVECYALQQQLLLFIDSATIEKNMEYCREQWREDHRRENPEPAYPW